MTQHSINTTTQSSTYIPFFFSSTFITMLLFSTFSQTLLYTFFFLFFSLSLSQDQPPIDPLEQKALYDVLNSLNPTIPWTTDYPDDLCLSAPHGVVCDYFPSDGDNAQNQQQKAHIIELNFGYVSDETPNPPCSPNATLNPLLFTAFPYLQKLFFYQCFNNTHNPLHLTSLPSLPTSLQELVFIQNPSIVSPIKPFLRNLTSLRRLVLIGNAFHGELPFNIGEYTNLEELTLSTNNLSGVIPASLGMLKKLKILDLSQNGFTACVPEQVGNLTSLLKLDLSYNGFGCKIPESFIHLQNMKFLDLSFNLFGNFGVPLFLGEITGLKEVYLSGNLLSGKIPEIWEKLGGVEKIGFSKMGLLGKIPVSMGIYLKNLTYLGLDNNNLEGPVPEEFGLLEFANEINLENNNLSGRISLPSRVEQKLKLAGNIGLCLGNNASCSFQNGESLSQLNPYKITDIIPDHDGVLFNGDSLLHFDPLILVLVLVGWFLLIFPWDG